MALPKSPSRFRHSVFAIAVAVLPLLISAGAQSQINVGPAINVDQGLTANGTTQRTATLVRSQANVFTTVGSGGSAVLPATGGSHAQVTLINQGANTLSVYPPLGGQIDQLGVNAPFSLIAGGSAQFTSVTAPTNGFTNWFSQPYSNAGGSGGVSSVGGTTANGVTVTVTNPTTTPVVSVAPAISGIVSASGGQFAPTTAIDALPIGQVTPAPVAGTTVSATSGVVDTSPATGYGINTTSGLKIGGGGGGSAPIGNGAVVDNEISYTYNLLGQVRERYFYDNITIPPGTTSNIDEGFYYGRTIGGTGTITGEINGYHSYMTDVVGVVANNSTENFEASTLYNAVHNVTINYFALQHFSTTGSSTGHAIGTQYGLTNDNVTPGSILNWTAISFTPVAGSGSAPTHDYIIQSTDPVGAAAILGPVLVGSVASSSTAQFYVQNALGAGFNVAQFRSNAGAQLFNLSDNGNASFSSGTLSAVGLSASGSVTFSGLSSGTQVSCLGLNSGNLIVTSAGACGSGGGGSVSSVANSDSSLTISPTTGSVIASLNTANANSWTATQTLIGADTSGATHPLVVKNSAANNAFIVSDDLSAAVGGVLTVGTTGTAVGQISFLSATAGSGAIKLTPVSGLLTNAIIQMPDLSGTIALLNPGTSQAFTGLVNFATIVESGGTAVLSNATAPTISGGFGTSPTISGGTTAWFRVNVGTGGTANTGVVTLPAVGAGYNCFANDSATNAASIRTQAIIASTSTVTLNGISVTTGAPAAWPSGEVITVSCIGD